MVDNFMALISQALSAAITTRIASAFGLNEAQVRKAIDAAIPALLGALISLVSKPQGAVKLYNVVMKQEPQRCLIWPMRLVRLDNRPSSIRE